MILCTTHHEGCACREAAHRETEAQRDLLAAALEEIAEWSQELQDRVALNGDGVAMWRGCVATARRALGMERG